MHAHKKPLCLTENGYTVILTLTSTLNIILIDINPEPCYKWYNGRRPLNLAMKGGWPGFDSLHGHIHMVWVFLLAFCSAKSLLGARDIRRQSDMQVGIE